LAHNTTNITSNSARATEVSSHVLYFLLVTPNNGIEAVKLNKIHINKRNVKRWQLREQGYEILHSTKFYCQCNIMAKQIFRCIEYFHLQELIHY